MVCLHSFDVVLCRARVGIGMDDGKDGGDEGDGWSV